MRLLLRALFTSLPPTRQPTVLGRCSFSRVSLHPPGPKAVLTMLYSPSLSIHTTALLVRGPLSLSTFPAREHRFIDTVKFLPFLLFSSSALLHNGAAHRDAVFAPLTFRAQIPHCTMGRTALLVFSLLSSRSTAQAFWCSFSLSCSHPLSPYLLANGVWLVL